MLNVNGGVGDTSYANNSSLQGNVISMTWKFAKEGIAELICNSDKFPTTLTMAELGCSSGPNALVMASNIVKQVEEIRQRLQQKPLEYQILLNDLHGNDFNSIFKSLPSFMINLNTQIGPDFGPCFFNGVPGCFYNRLFLTQSVHFFHSSYSLQWLSQVPEGVENNKGNIFMSSRSPKNVIEAYYKQFQKDFSMFLKCRAAELVNCGYMVLTLIGRSSEDPWSEECTSYWEFLSLALNSMVVEGLVEEEKVESFNIPNYMPSPKEVKVEVLKEGSFRINELEVTRIDWNLFDKSSNTCNDKDNAAAGCDEFAKCVRSVAESLLITHFGQSIIEELFRRYKNIIAHNMSKDKLQLINLRISLTKIKL